jgi:Tol biopolymer transport system component
MSYLLPRRRGDHPFRPVLFIAIGAGIGLSAAFLFFAPRVTAFSPASGEAVGSYAAVEISFSVPMDPECTAAHFSIDPAVEGELTIEGDSLRFAPKDPWPSGGGVRAALQAGACSTRGLPLLGGVSWTFTPTLLRLAFLPSGGTSGSLMGVPADGGEPSILARAPEPIQDYDLSQRGDFAVFSTGPLNQPGKLWRTRLDGGEAELLLDCGSDSCSEPALSPDGFLVAYVRKPAAAGVENFSSPYIELLTLSDGRTRRISSPGHVAGNPTWSGQGWLSYFDGSRPAIVVDDLAGGQTVIPNYTGATWCWLPDGSAIIFPEIEIASGDENEESSPRLLSPLFRVELKTNRRINLSGADLLEDGSPAVSPDGLRLAFSRNFFDARWTPGKQLWIMDLEGGSLRQLSRAPDYSYSAIRWSPDGSLLVCMLFHETAPEDPPEIWRLGADGSDPRRLVVGGFLPKWLP